MPAIHNPPRAHVLVASYYEASERSALRDSIRAAHLPKGTEVDFGTEGVNAADAAAAHAIAGGRYAPILNPLLKDHPTRRLTPEEEARLPRGSARYAKGHGPLGAMPPKEQYAWGVEMGRRMRDQLRAAQKAGVRVDSYQLDEIWPSASLTGAQGKIAMRFMRGVLDGVRLGRPELGDRPMRGLLHLARPKRFAALPSGPERDALLHALNLTARDVIGEQYQNFAGDPKKAADAQERVLARLARDGKDGQALAQRYVAGLTPGLLRVGALGGKLPSQTVAQANAWRDAFVREAVRRGVAGISEFNWLPQHDAAGNVTGVGNSDPATMQAVFDSIGSAFSTAR